MSDHHLFYLDAAQEWDLAADANQWIIRRRRSARKAPTGSSGGDQNAIYAWEPLAVGSEKRTLYQFIDGRRGPPLSPEKRPRILLTPEAVLALSELPDSFLMWLDWRPIAVAAE